MSNPARLGSRNHQFDLLRIVLATLVLLAHAPEITDGNRSRELLSRIAGQTMTFGIVAVDGFFLLSGFLIVQSWERNPELLNFLRKRLLRIVPGYLVAVVLSILVIGSIAPAVDHYFSHIGYLTFRSIVFLHEPKVPPVYPGDPYHAVNGPTWTIFYEFRCYLLVPLLGFLGLLRRRWACVVLALTFLTIMSSPTLLAHLNWTVYTPITGETEPTFRLTAAFLAGTCFYLNRNRIRFSPTCGVAAVALLIVVRFLTPALIEAAFVVCGGYLLFYFGSLSLSALDFMRWVPDVSYGIYLYGWPVESLWIWFHHGSPWITFAVSVPTCLALGWISWHFIERPALTLKRRPTAPLPAA